jgi:UDP-GlcNAc:undecaprenyl-phosphate GlcNAc-1-phosphate transferase
MTGITIPAIVIVVVALLCSFLLVRALRSLAPVWGLLDYPGGRKRHKRAVPLVGGLAVTFAGFVALGIGAIFWHELGNSSSFPWWFLLGVALMLLAGLLDDKVELPHWAKAILQVGAVLVVVFLADTKVSTLGALLGGHAISLGDAAIPFTLICLLGYVNAVNLIDGLDGLGGGVAVIAMAFLAAIAGVHGLSAWFLVALAFLAATLAFLVYNLRTPWRSRATVFLGDAGSMALGLVVGGIAVGLAGRPVDGAPSPIAIAWILALPVMDTVIVMLRRLALRRNPFKPDRLHLHHVLVDMGLSPGRATAVLLALAVLYGLYGLIASLTGLAEWILFASFLGVFVLHALFLLMAHRQLHDSPMKLAHPHTDSLT